MMVLEKPFGLWVVKNRAWILFVTVLFMLFPIYGLKSVYMDPDYRSFIGNSLTSGQDMLFIEDMFDRQNNIMLVIAPANGEVFNKELLALIRQLTDEAWQLPFVQRVDALANFQYTRAQGDELTVNDLITHDANLSQKQIANLKKAALSEPRLVRNLVSTAADVTAINIVINLPNVDKKERNTFLLHEIEVWVANYKQQYPDIAFYLTGTFMQDQMADRALTKDLSSLVPIVMGMMFIILWIAIRNIITVVLTVIVVSLAIVMAIGFGSAAGIYISPPVAASPTIILTIAIANCVHILVTFIQQLQENQTKNDAIIESLHINVQPVFLTSITTAFGFLTLNLAEIPPFRDLGNMVTIGVVGAFFLSVFTLPACLSYAPIKIKQPKKLGNFIFGWLNNFIIRRQNLLLATSLIILLGSIVALSNNVFNDNPLKYFKAGNDYRVSTEFTNDHLTGVTALDFYFESGEEGGINQPEFLQEVENFSNWFVQQESVLHINTYTDTLKRLNQNMHGDAAEYYRLPESRELAAQYLLLYELSLPYGLDLANEINIDKSAIRVRARLKAIDDVEFAEVQQQAMQWIASNLTHITEVKGSSLNFAYSKISIVSSKTLVFGTFFALTLISILLMIAFRSVYVGLISFVSNLAPAIVGFGIWGVLVGEIGSGTSIVAAVTIGIVVDDTVHIFSKYLRARREKNLPVEEAVDYALKTVGRALVITSTVLIMGFMVLLLSDFRFNYEMGLLTSIVISCALGAVFLLVPPLMLKFPRIR